MASILNDIPTLVSILQKGAAFEAGTAVTIAIPAESYTVQVPEVGAVTISESGTTVTVKKA